MSRTSRRSAAKAAAGKLQESDQEEESEWEGSQEPSEEEELEEDSEEEEEVEDKKPPAKKRAPPKPARKKKKRRVVFDSDDEEDDQLPTHARKTARGGYAHTTASRKRIAKANAGNVPWNKGRNRSEADKAKIAAGVRARNRAILLEKLKKLGMTEEEWLQKKKEIKYLRERVRRAKKAAQKRDEKGKQRKAKNEKSYEDLKDELARKLAEQMQQMQSIKVEADATVAASAATAEEAQPQKEDKAPAILQQVFAPAIEWSPHDYDKSKDHLYEQLCPSGGPGGLVCCDVCASSYSRYMTQTANDIEVHTIHNVGKEVSELLGFVGEVRSKIQTKVRLAQGKAPPSQPGLLMAASKASSVKGDGDRAWV